MNLSITCFCIGCPDIVMMSSPGLIENSFVTTTMVLSTRLVDGCGGSNSLPVAIPYLLCLKLWMLF